MKQKNPELNQQKVDQVDELRKKQGLSLRAACEEVGIGMGLYGYYNTKKNKIKVVRKPRKALPTVFDFQEAPVKEEKIAVIVIKGNIAEVSQVLRGMV